MAFHSPSQTETSDHSSSYNWLSRQFHWFIAVLIFAAFALGLTMEPLALSKEKLNFYAWHKWLGLFILALVVLRLCWRFVTKAPSHSSAQVPQIFHFAAKVGHFLLYAVLLLLPLVGWLRSSSAGFEIVIFEVLPVPDLIGKDEVLSSQLAQVHYYLALFLALLVVGHVAAVIIHHLFFKDPILQKMKPHFLHKALIAFALLGGVGFYVYYTQTLGVEGPKKAEKPVKEVTEKEISSKEKDIKSESAKSDVSSRSDAEPRWDIDEQVSLLEFTATQKGAKTTGVFKKYQLKQLVFNPDELDKAVVELEIDVTSISLSNVLVEQTLASSSWFDAGEFPKATFQSKSFKSLGGDVYEVAGNLTIKDIVQPNIIKLTIQLATATEDERVVIEAKGETVISRLAYKIGQGEWASTDDLADEVQLKIHIRALKTD